MSKFDRPMDDWERMTFNMSGPGNAIQMYELQREAFQRQGKAEEQIRQMSRVMEQLLAHNLSQAAELERQIELREKLESTRFNQNTLLSLIAALTGAIALGITVWQLYQIK